jgi:hypothetical protein
VVVAVVVVVRQAVGRSLGLIRTREFIHLEHQASLQCFSSPEDHATPNKEIKISSITHGVYLCCRTAWSPLYPHSLLTTVACSQPLPPIITTHTTSYYEVVVYPSAPRGHVDYSEHSNTETAETPMLTDLLGLVQFDMVQVAGMLFSSLLTVFCLMISGHAMCRKL